MSELVRDIEPSDLPEIDKLIRLTQRGGPIKNIQRLGTY